MTPVRANQNTNLMRTAMMVCRRSSLRTNIPNFRVLVRGCLSLRETPLRTEPEMCVDSVREVGL